MKKTLACFQQFKKMDSEWQAEANILLKYVKIHVKDFQRYTFIFTKARPIDTNVDKLRMNFFVDD